MVLWQAKFHQHPQTKITPKLISLPLCSTFCSLLPLLKAKIEENPGHFQHPLIFIASSQTKYHEE